MGQQSLAKVFGPMCTLVTQKDVKGNKVSMNALAASRMMAFFRRGLNEECSFKDLILKNQMTPIEIHRRRSKYIYL